MTSVVVPVFNEAPRLGAAIASVMVQPPGKVEVIVVDGGSSDESVEIAYAAGAKVVRSERRQRAAQMNLGALRSSGEALLFLHADTVLPPGALERIENALEDQRVVGGCFAKRYQPPVPFFLRMASHIGEARSRAAGWFFGDQAIFIRRKVFEEIGGYPDMDVFEDLELSLRMKPLGGTVVLRPPVISSGRRFTRRGAWRTTWNDVRLTLGYIRGKPFRTGRSVTAPAPDAGVEP